MKITMMNKILHFLKKVSFSTWVAAGLLIVVIFNFVQTKSQPRYLPGKWDKLTLILNQIDKHYVDTIDYKDMVEKTIPMVLAELDPHSVYLPPEQRQKADEELEGNFDGIGIQFNVPNDTAIVISVIAGGPSEKAGLLSGDRIIKVGERVVAGVKIDQDTIVKLIKGPSGTEVGLMIKRSGERDLIPFMITRDKIPVKSVDVAYMINDTLGYINLSKFAKTSYAEFVEAVDTLKKQGMSRLLFDLRSNSGGYLDQALLLANEFLAKDDLILYMEGRKRARQDFFADGRGKYQDMELGVLINEGSASSSEIFAGAIQDNDRGTIYGRRSFGKGLVQEPIYFTDKSAIRLTVARFYTPTGRSIQKPYSSDEDYRGDIMERYRHGEMMEADSIRRDDSSKFVTPKGKIVYGGGGIIPDVFVPLDTVGVTDMLIKINRRSLQERFSIEMADKYRRQLREVTNLKELNSFLDGIDIERRFLDYIQKNEITPVASQWDISKETIITQIRAFIGRYSSLDNYAFFPIIAKIDNVIQVAIEQ